MSAPATELPRAALLAQAGATQRWDVIIIGGGATGLGVALQAAAEGLRVLLLEAGDFASGTSSRSTKLLHGGVRYLAQGHLGLVRDALSERQTVIRNAPTLAHPLGFVLPTYGWHEAWKYRLGLHLYDLLSGDASLGKTGWVAARQAIPQWPQLKPDALRGLVTYWDAQFDDASLGLALAQTAHRRGALLLNHCAVQSVEVSRGRVVGVRWADRLEQESHLALADCVINAAGVWIDALRPSAVAPSVTLSRGSHLVVDRSFWPHDQGLIVPQTRDGRVMFVLPWLGRVMLGTTDVPCAAPTVAPRPEADEIDFILQEAARHLTRAPQVSDISSMWAGLRALVKPVSGSDTPTRQIGREHAIWQDSDGLVCVAGGKWTTYRLMAEQVLAFCRQAGHWPHAPGQVSTRTLSLEPGQPDRAVAQERGWPMGLSPDFIRWHIRHTQACTVEDVLARRSRLLFVDARQAHDIAPEVARVMHEAGVSGVGLDAFLTLARQHWPQTPDPH